MVVFENEAPKVIAEQEAPVKTESPEENNLREKQEARRLRLARSPPPVRRIAEQLTPLNENSSTVIKHAWGEIKRVMQFEFVF